MSWVPLKVGKKIRGVMYRETELRDGKNKGEKRKKFEMCMRMCGGKNLFAGGIGRFVFMFVII